MDNKLKEEIAIKQLEKGETIPYELLLDADPSKELVDNYLSASEVFIAIYENNTIGVYVLYPLNSNSIEIKNIAVEESFQGKGIGKLLLNHALQRAKELGYLNILIGTSSVSIGPLYLYQKMGFEVSYIIENFFIKNYPEPIFDNGIQCKHMIVLKKAL